MDLIDFYKSLRKSLTFSVKSNPDWSSFLSNMSSSIYWGLNSCHDLSNAINWCGFYIQRKINGLSDVNSPLILGPFQGKPAVSIIAPTRGVCGESFSKKSFVAVPDVHLHPDHITCDSDSKSELVIPMWVNNRCVGVLDLDSRLTNCFSDSDGSQFQLILNEVLELATIKYGSTYFDQNDIVLTTEQFDAIRDSDIIGCSYHKHH